MIRARSWRRARIRLARARRPLGRYAGKFAGDGPTAGERPPLRAIAASWLGALAALAALCWLAEATGAPLVMAPFGASVVLLFAQPDSQLTQPRNVIGGHLLGGAIGVALGMHLGDTWIVLALAVATTVALTKATRTVHPPAGATAIVCLHLQPDWRVLLAPVLAGSAVLVATAALYNNAIEHRRYPLRWW